MPIGPPALGVVGRVGEILVTVVTAEPEPLAGSVPNNPAAAADWSVWTPANTSASIVGAFRTLTVKLIVQLANCAMLTVEPCVNTTLPLPSGAPMVNVTPTQAPAPVPVALSAKTPGSGVVHPPPEAPPPHDG